MRRCLWVGVIALWGCTQVESLGTWHGAAADSDTAADLPGTGFATDSQMDVDTGSDPLFEVIRVDFVPAGDGPLDTWIDRTDNAVGLQGGWYAFSDVASAVSVFNAGNGAVCAQGRIARADGVSVVYGGAGVSLCNTGADGDPPWEMRPLGTCPLADVADRFAGVALTLEGPSVPAELGLEFKQQGRVDTQRIPMTPGEGTYWVHAVSDVDVEKITAVQFQVGASLNRDVDFEFCIRSVALLLKK